MQVEEAREVAEIINCIADLFTMSVGGCMGAQVYHEVYNDPGLRPPEPDTIERDPLKPGAGGYGTTGGGAPVAIGVPVTVKK